MPVSPSKKGHARKKKRRRKTIMIFGLRFFKGAADMELPMPPFESNWRSKS